MNSKKGSPRKPKADKQSAGESKTSKGRDRSSSKKTSLNKRNSTSLAPDKRGGSATPDKLEASSSFPQGTIICCRKEHRPGVSIKDVGLDIAGFLIEEEIKKNKEKLKLEIVKQIALSKELDKHLERQRCIMNNYIRHNALEGSYRAQISNNIPDKCSCMVCQEAAKEETFPTCTCRPTPKLMCACKTGIKPICLCKPTFTERPPCACKPPCLENSFQPSKRKCICYNERSPTIRTVRNSCAQSTPLTKDFSCQGNPFQEMCQQCNTPQRRSSDCKTTLPSTCTPLQSTKMNAAESGIEGYFEDYSSIQNYGPNNRLLENRFSTSQTPANRLRYSQTADKSLITGESQPNTLSPSQKPATSSYSPSESPANRLSTIQPPISRYSTSQTPANRFSVNEIPSSTTPEKKLSTTETPTKKLSIRESLANRFSLRKTPSKKLSGSEITTSRMSTSKLASTEAGLQSSTPANITTIGGTQLSRISRDEEHTSKISTSELPYNGLSTSKVPSNRLSTSDIPSNRLSNSEIPSNKISTIETETNRLSPASRLSTFDTPANRFSMSQTPTTQTPASRLSTFDTQANRLPTFEPPANRLATFEPPANRLSTSQTPAKRLSNLQTPTNRLSNFQTPANRLSSFQTPASQMPPNKQTDYYDEFTQSNPVTYAEQSTEPCKCISRSQCTQANIDLEEPKDATTEVTDQMLSNLNTILKTPLNTIQTQQDPTEVILSNIKGIIRDYMENINIKCTNCQTEANTAENRLVKVDSKDMTSKQDLKSDISTKCENDGTHIDIMLQFCEFNKKKRAILEIEPCFDEKRCMKYNKKDYAKEKCYEEEVTYPSSCGSSTCTSSRKYNPYRERDHRKSYRPKLRKNAGMNNRRRRSNIPSILCKEHVSCQSSNDSVKIIRINRNASKPSSVGLSSSSNSFEEKRFRPKRSNLRKSNKAKATICSYAPNVAEYPKEHSRHKRKKSSQSSIKVSQPKKEEHKSSKKTEHRSHKTRTEKEDTKKHKDHKKPEQSCYQVSSNQDETSYKKIASYRKPKTPTKKECPARKTSHACTTISSSNIDTSKFYSKKDNETTLGSYPSDILSSLLPISEQWSISGFEQEDTLTSTLPVEINLDKAPKERNTKTVNKNRNVLNEPSSSFDKSEITSKPRQPDLKTPKENDSSDEEITQIEDLNAYPKISSDGGVVILSPLFKTKRIQLIQKWLAYMHKLQGKEHFKTIAPAIVAIKLPTSSKYVLPNENSDEQVEYVLTPKTMFSSQVSENCSNELKESAFGKFRESPQPEISNKNTQPERTVHNKWATHTHSKTDGFIKNSRKSGLDLKKHRSEILYSESSSYSEFNVIGSSFSDTSFESTSESLLDVNVSNHCELIQDLICPYRDTFKGRYFNVSETDRIINRAFYIQDIFVNLASTDEEKNYWRDTVLQAMKDIVTNTA